MYRGLGHATAPTPPTNKKNEIQILEFRLNERQAMLLGGVYQQKKSRDTSMTINNLTPGFHLSVLFLMIKFCQNNNKKMSISLIQNTLTKLWSKNLIN